MRLVLAFVALLLVAAAPPRPPCPLPADHRCAIGETTQMRLGDGDIVTAERIIRIDPAALPLERPLAVEIAALASAEVTWNGRIVGRNGIPGPDATNEVTGRYFSTFTIPSALVRPGDNVVAVRLSANRLWLPVRRPVHRIDIGAYETPELPGRSTYLPALLALGAMAVAFAYFAAAAWARARGGAMVAGFALAAMLQLGAEVSRAFLSFTYPWALGRVTAIAVLAAAASVLMVAYAAQRFAPERQRLFASLAVAAAAASVILLPWFDFKALGAILAGALLLAAAAIQGLRRRAPGARWVLAAAVAIVAIMAWQATAFLDMAWHLIVAALLVLLVVEQLGQLRAARAGAARAAALEERLRRAEETGEPILALKTGSRLHRIAEADILYLRAADDYSEAMLADGRTILVTMTLARLLETLPERFMRVHKSYAVNRVHVASLAPKPGGGRLLKLDDGSDVPVGRSYAAAVAAAIASPPSIAYS